MPESGYTIQLMPGPRVSKLKLVHITLPQKAYNDSFFHKPFLITPFVNMGHDENCGSVSEVAQPNKAHVLDPNVTRST